MIEGGLGLRVCVVLGKGFRRDEGPIGEFGGGGNDHHNLDLELWVCSLGFKTLNPKPQTQNPKP